MTFIGFTCPRCGAEASVFAGLFLTKLIDEPKGRAICHACGSSLSFESNEEAEQGFEVKACDPIN